GPAKTKHQKVASETRGRDGASVAQFPTRRTSRIREMPRYRAVLRGLRMLAGGDRGSRIRTAAQRRSRKPRPGLKTAVDPSMLRIVARAHDIQARLSQNTERTVHDVAREEHMTAAYIYTLLRLPWLAPDITTAIVNGRQPHQLNAKTLMRKASRLPTDWAEQRTLLGF